MAVKTAPVGAERRKRGGGVRRGDFPAAERAAQEVLSLPMYPELTAEQIDRVAGALADALNH